MQVVVDGESLLTTGHGWSEITVTDHLLGGCWEAAWQMRLPVGYRHRLLDRGLRVEVFDGPTRVFRGTSQQADYAGGRFTAFGPWRDAENYPAFDGGGSLTTVPDTAIDAQITAGWDVVRYDSYGASALASASTTTGLLSLAELLTLSAKVVSQYPYVDTDGVIARISPDADPSWVMVPASVELGNGDDEYVSRVLLRYSNSAAGGALATADEDDPDAAARFGVKMLQIDATEIGQLAPAMATNLAAGILADGRARPAFTNTIEATPWTLMNVGGKPADLSLVKCGEKVRIAGIFDNAHDLDGRTWLDVTVGETTKRWVGDRCRSLTISPAGLLPRTYMSVIEKRMAAVGDSRLVKF